MRETGRTHGLEVCCALFLLLQVPSEARGGRVNLARVREIDTKDIEQQRCHLAQQRQVPARARGLLCGEVSSDEHGAQEAECCQEDDGGGTARKRK